MTSASKAAAWSYSNSARVQLKTQGTEVLGVHVGYVDTDLIASFEVEKIAPVEVATAALDALDVVRVGVAWTERADPLVRARVEAAAALFPDRRTLDLPLADGIYTGFAREAAEVHGALFAERSGGRPYVSVRLLD